MNNCKHLDIESVCVEGTVEWCADCGATRLNDGYNTTWDYPKNPLVPEIVICSAIRLPNGKIFRGHRHPDCIETAFKFVSWNGGVDPGEHHWDVGMCLDQGFITSCNRYVDRKEGLQLQLAAGIDSACRSGYRVSDFFSEDLY